MSQLKVLGRVSGTTNALKSCGKMLRRYWNIQKDKGNSGNSTAKKNNLLKILTYKTSKFKNVKSSCTETNRRNGLF
jgi:hypothetical protein